MKLRENSVDGWIIYSKTENLANASGENRVKGYHRQTEHTDDPRYLPSLKHAFRQLGKPILWESEVRAMTAYLRTMC